MVCVQCILYLDLLIRLTVTTRKYHAIAHHSVSLRFVFYKEMIGSGQRLFRYRKIGDFGVGLVWSPNNLVNLYPLVVDNLRYFYYLAKTNLSTDPYDRR